MISKILLSTCLAFCFVQYSSAKLEIVLAFTVDPDNENLTVAQAERTYESGQYLADSYRRGFKIRDSYKADEIDFTSSDSAKSYDLGKAMKAGTLSKDHWEYKPSTEEELRNIPSLDEKFLYYPQCAALWRQMKTDIDGATDVDEVRKMLKEGKTLKLSPQSKRLSGGPILFEVMVALYQKRNKILTEGSKPKAEEGKMILYTLPKELFVFVVSAFSPDGTKFIGRNFDKVLRPKFGATFVVEVHIDTDEKSKWKIKYLYRNEDKFILKPLILPGCKAARCSFDKVFNQLQPYMVYKRDIKKECQKTEISDFTQLGETEPLQLEDYQNKMDQVQSIPNRSGRHPEQSGKSSEQEREELQVDVPVYRPHPEIPRSVNKIKIA